MKPWCQCVGSQAVHFREHSERIKHYYGRSVAGSMHAAVNITVSGCRRDVLKRNSNGDVTGSTTATVASNMTEMWLPAPEPVGAGQMSRQCMHGLSRGVESLHLVRSLNLIVTTELLSMYVAALDHVHVKSM